MQVSVIIPVYNAAEFVTQAVESALAQPETAEVLLVEDGSLDGGLKVCQDLAEQYSKVRLFRHPGGENRGAGASRNLGMRHAACDYIAFLDADDYYLRGRFTKAREIFESTPDCEGVYEAIGMQIEDEKGLQRWKEAGRPERRLTTLNKPVKPEDLGEVLVSGECGHFSLDGLVIKKTILAKAGIMEEKLLLHQDTNFIIRLALSGSLHPGRLGEPVCLFRVHAHNRISAPRSVEQKYQDQTVFLMVTYRWCKAHSLKNICKLLIHRMVLNAISKLAPSVQNSAFITRTKFRSLNLLAWIWEYPDVIIDPNLWRSVVRLAISHGRNI